MSPIGTKEPLCRVRSTFANRCKPNVRSRPQRALGRACSHGQVESFVFDDTITGSRLSSGRKRVLPRRLPPRPLRTQIGSRLPEVTEPQRDRTALASTLRLIPCHHVYSAFKDSQIAGHWATRELAAALVHAVARPYPSSRRLLLAVASDGSIDEMNHFAKINL